MVSFFLLPNTRLVQHSFEPYRKQQTGCINQTSVALTPLPSSIPGFWTHDLSIVSRLCYRLDHSFRLYSSTSCILVYLLVFILSKKVFRTNLVFWFFLLFAIKKVNTMLSKIVLNSFIFSWTVDVIRHTYGNSPSKLVIQLRY